MADNAQVLPPEASASDLMELNDADLAKFMGLPGEGDGKPDSAAEAASPGETKAEEVAAPEGEAKPEEAAPAPEGEAEGEPEPEPEPEPEKPKRVPLTKFAVLDGEEEVEIPDNLVFKYEANGKQREVQLDKLVQMAQMGHYNHEKQQEVKEREARAEQAIQENQQLSQAVQQFQDYFGRVFTDLEFFDAAREAYLKEQSPERQVARAQQTIQQERAQIAQDRDAMQVTRVLESSVNPTIQRLIEQNPLVTQHEVLGLWTQLTAPLLDRGRLPVARLAEVQTLTERDLAYQVQGLQTERADAEARKNKALQVEKGKTVQAKRQIARTAAPKGASVPDTPKPKVFESAEDWFANDPVLNPKT